MSAALQSLSADTGLRLDAAPDLEVQKVVIITHHQPLLATMNAVATLLGAKWWSVKKPDGIHYELKRLSDVQDWLEQRSKLPSVRQLARQIDTGLIQADLRDELGKEKPAPGNPPEKMSRMWEQFVASLPPASLDSIAAALAGARALTPWNPEGFGELPPPAVVARVGSLTPDQQNDLRAALPQFQTSGGSPGGKETVLDSTSMMETRLPSMTVTVPFFESPGSLIPGLFDPASHQPVSALQTVNIRYRVVLMGELMDPATEQRNASLARLPAPKDALLGMDAGPGAKNAGSVILSSDWAARGIQLPPTSLLRWQLLSWLGDQAGFNVVADQYTLSQRLPTERGTLARVLQSASGAYDSIFKQDGEFLLARRIPWPDDDAAEIPWPLPERWISRQSGGKYLTLDDCEAMAACSDVQLTGLWAYTDRAVDFTKVIRSVAMDDDRRLLLKLLGQAPEKVKRRVTLPAGLPLSDLKLDSAPLASEGMPVLGQYVNWGYSLTAGVGAPEAPVDPHTGRPLNNLTLGQRDTAKVRDGVSIMAKDMFIPDQAPRVVLRLSRQGSVEPPIPVATLWPVVIGP